MVPAETCRKIQAASFTWQLGSKLDSAPQHRGADAPASSTQAQFSWSKMALEELSVLLRVNVHNHSHFRLGKSHRGGQILRSDWVPEVLLKVSCYSYSPQPRLPTAVVELQVPETIICKTMYRLELKKLSPSSTEFFLDTNSMPTKTMEFPGCTIPHITIVIW